MKITWLGHAAFLFTCENNMTILTDPYEHGSYGGAVQYAPITVAADIVTVSHAHPDHCALDTLSGSPRIINAAGEYSVNNIDIKGVDTFHDAQQGSARGGNIIFRFIINDVSIVHLGDLGHVLDDATIVALGSIDVLLIPVGGTFTVGPKEAGRVIDDLRPRLVIPMHFKTQKLGFDIKPVDAFLQSTRFAKEQLPSSDIHIQKQSLPERTRIVVLQHSQ